jgi:hypothetical protein
MDELKRRVGEEVQVFTDAKVGRSRAGTLADVDATGLLLQVQNPRTPDELWYIPWTSMDYVAFLPKAES